MFHRRLPSLLHPGRWRGHAVRSPLMRITSIVLVVLALSVAIILFPRAISASAHTSTSQQQSTTAHPQAQVTRQDVFARGTDATLWHRWRLTGSRDWSPWQSLGVQIDFAPGVIAIPGSDEIDGVYVRSPDIWFFSYNPRTNQLTTKNLGFDCSTGFGDFCVVGRFQSAPSIINPAPGILDVYAIVGQTLFHKSRVIQTPIGLPPTPVWSNWSSLSVGSFVGSPAPVSWGPNRTDVFIRDTSNHLEDKVFQNGHWSLWQDLGGILTSSPFATLTAPGTLTVFVRNTDSGVSSRTFSNGAWGPWSTTTTTFSYAVPAASPSATGGLFDLFLINVVGGVQGGVVSLLEFSSPTTIVGSSLGGVSSSVFLSSVSAVVGTYP